MRDQADRMVRRDSADIDRNAGPSAGGQLVGRCCGYAGTISA